MLGTALIFLIQLVWDRAREFNFSHVLDGAASPGPWMENCCAEITRQVITK